MIKSYLEFIIESTTELSLIYSNGFREHLNKMGNDPVANLLLLCENNASIKDAFTLCDLTDKNDTISVIQVNRITRENPNPNISELRDENSDFWKRARTEIGVGKWSRRIVNKIRPFTDSQIENFVNLWKAKIDEDEIELEIVEGEEIRKWYNGKNYESVRGELGNSCMRYNSCQPFFDIYVWNPDVCKLIIKKNSAGDKISGRALLWKLEDGRWYMDRPYTILNSDEVLFNEFAKKRGYIKFIDEPEDISVKLGDHEYTTYPYMDTFLCYNPDLKRLSDDWNLWPLSGYIKLQDTEGGFVTNKVVRSEFRDQWIPEDQAIFCDDIQDYTWRFNATYLEYIDQWFGDSSNTRWSEWEEEYYKKEDSVWSNMMNSYIYKNNKDLIWVETNGDPDPVLHIDEFKFNIIKIDNTFYKKSDTIIEPYTKEILFRWSDEAEDLFDKISKELGYDIDIRDLKISSDRIKGFVSDTIIEFKKLDNSIKKDGVNDIIKIIKDMNLDYTYSNRLNTNDDTIVLMMISSFAFNKNDWGLIDKIKELLYHLKGERLLMEWDEVKELYKLSYNFDWFKFGENIGKRITMLRIANSY
jgi:hypothetical protein